MRPETANTSSNNKNKIGLNQSTNSAAEVPGRKPDEEEMMQQEGRKSSRMENKKWK
jgi:hypothetical protein